MRGDLLFSSGTDFVSRAIMLVTAGQFSHVAIMLSEETVLSVTAFGVMGEVARYDGVIAKTAVYCSSSNLDRALTWAMAQKGGAYDYQDALQIGWYSLFPFLKKPVVSEQTKAYTCSELAGYFLLKAGYPFVQKRTFNDMEYTSPNHLYQWLRTS